MKRSSLIFWTALTFIAAGGVWAAQSAAPKAATDSPPAAAAKTPAVVNYTFDDTPLDRSNSTRVTSYADMLDKVTPAVVSIYTSISLPTLRGGGRRGQPGQPPNAAPAATNGDQRTVPFGVGSGSIISSDGYIITNHHVVTDQNGRPATDIRVELPDGRSYTAKLVGSDESIDIALLKIDAKNLPTIKLASSDKLRVGDVVFAIGDPMEVGLTVTHGIVSAMGRSPSDMTDIGSENYIQTDAAINPGNSGGPLVDADGRLIGMSTAIYSDSGGSIGLGFAIPELMARHVVDDIIKYGQVRRSFFGVDPQEVDHNLAQALDLPTVHGALLASVETGLPGSTAGLQRGDFVVKMNGEEVDSPGKFRYITALADPGDTIKLTVLRDGKSQLIPVKVGDRDQVGTTEIETANAAAAQAAQAVQAARLAQLARAAYAGGGRRNAPTPPLAGDTTVLSGVGFDSLSDDLRAQLSIPDAVKGVAVMDISPRSTYVDLFEPGVVVLEVNKHPVASVDDLRAQIKPGVVNVFYIYREGHYAYVGESMPTQK